MSTEAWTLLGLIVTTIGQIIMAYMMYHVRHSINGMQGTLVAFERKEARDEERANPTLPDATNPDAVKPPTLETR